jgi:hypothetical protein
MNPWSRIIFSRTKRKKMRAIRFPTWERISHNPSPIGAHVDIPNGHPYSTFRTSLAVGLSQCHQPLSHWRPAEFGLVEFSRDQPLGAAVCTTGANSCASNDTICRWCDTSPYAMERCTGCRPMPWTIQCVIRSHQAD